MEESIRNEDPIQSMMIDAFGFTNHINEEPHVANEACDGDERASPELNNGAEGEAKDFYELLKDGEKVLYDGCKKYTKLSFLIKLYHIKSLCGVTNKAILESEGNINLCISQIELYNIYRYNKEIKKN